MKKLVIILCMLLAASGVRAQNHRHNNDHHRTEHAERGDRRHGNHDGHRDGHHDGHHDRNHDRHHDRNHDRHHDRNHDRHHDGHHDRHNDVHRGGGRHQGHHSVPDEVECLYDWQDLWNGCHVRLLGSRVLIVNRRGDTVVSGDRVFLTANGWYEVKNGGVWSVREADGDFTTLSGMDIFYWSEGFYGIKVGSFWRLYDEDGDMVGNIWGEHLTLYPDNRIKATRNGWEYYYDYDGNQLR